MMTDNYICMVRFTDGNTIWGRKMKNPGEFAGEPVCLFASLPDTWGDPWITEWQRDLG